MSKTVTKDRQCSSAVHVNRGIMRFSFVGVGPFRAFVSDVDTIGSFPSRADRPRGPREGRGVGRRLSRPGTFDIDGCSPRVRGQDDRPRTRDMSPAGVVGTRPRGMSPPVPQSVGIGDMGWRGMVKMAVQRPSSRLTLRLAPMPSYGAASSPWPAAEAMAATRPGGVLRPYGPKANLIWSVSCKL